MKLTTRIVLWCAVLLAVCAGSVPVGGQTGPAPGDSGPRTPLHPLRPPGDVARENTALPSSTVQSVPGLKAVLLVGPIDGDYGSWTQDEKANMDLAAAELEANGVDVIKFYTPNNNWEQIKAAAEGAHFLFYRGHGVYWSPMPTPTVGGFALKSKFVSSQEIREDLHLAPNAIVMLYGCFTAGSSGNDTSSISSAEAQRRVAQYSDPFFDIGAAGYYADWFGEAFQMYVRYLYAGQTLGQAYESFWDFHSSTVERYTHPDHSGLAMWLDKDYWYDPKPQYNNAFSGYPNKTLEDLFGPQLAISSVEIAYLAEPSSPAVSYAVRVDNAGFGSLTWTAAVTSTVGWMDAHPLSGSEGQEITVVITPTGTVGSYASGLVITADDLEAKDRVQSVSVRLWVVDELREAYLPAVWGGP